MADNSTFENDPCESPLEADYDLPLHIGAIFILFVCSAVGVFTPLITSCIYKSKKKKTSLYVVVLKYFGGGIIVGTAFIHILPAGIETLSDPCLGEFAESYEAYGGLFAMLGALTMHLIGWLSTVYIENQKSKEGKNKSPDGADCEMHEEGHHHEHDISIFEARKKVSTLLLELAIIIHSVIIGADLGLAQGEFNSLLIAISFHQFFEGLGLGYRIAESNFDRIWIGFINATVFAITTPIGIAIGVGVQVSGTLSGSRALIVRGILDSIAAGLLLYSSLVNVVAEEFDSKLFKAYKKKTKIICFMSLYLGVAVMAMIGKWA